MTEENREKLRGLRIARTEYGLPLEVLRALEDIVSFCLEMGMSIGEFEYWFDGEGQAHDLDDETLVFRRRYTAAMEKIAERYGK